MWIRIKLVLIFVFFMLYSIVKPKDMQDMLWYADYGKQEKDYQEQRKRLIASLTSCTQKES